MGGGGGVKGKGRRKETAKCLLFLQIRRGAEPPKKNKKKLYETSHLSSIGHEMVQHPHTVFEGVKREYKLSATFATQELKKQNQPENVKARV